MAALATLAVLATGVGLAVAHARRDDAPDLVALDEVFSDEGLRGCVARALDADGTARVPRDRLERLDRVSCANPEPDVASLEDLRHLPGLTSLDLVGTGVRTLPAGALPHLTDLSLTATGVTDLSALAALPSLTSLHLGGRCWAPQAPADLGALVRVRGLTRLTLDCVDADLTQVGRLTGLTDLYLSVPATDLGPLRPLASLRALAVVEMDVDLTPVADLRGLRSVDLARSRVPDLSPLAALPELARLDLTGATVGSLAPLADVPALEDLVLRGTVAPDAASLALDGVEIRR